MAIFLLWASISALRFSVSLYMCIRAIGLIARLAGKMQRKVIAILLLYAVILFFIIMPTGIANAEEYEVTFVLPDKCVIGTDLIIKGTSTGGDTIDITIDDIIAAVDISIDENGRFTKKNQAGLGQYLIDLEVM